LGADAEGYAGLRDGIDYHWWDLARNSPGYPNGGDDRRSSIPHRYGNYTRGVLENFVARRDDWVPLLKADGPHPLCPRAWHSSCETVK